MTLEKCNNCQFKGDKCYDFVATLQKDWDSRIECADFIWNGELI